MSTVSNTTTKSPAEIFDSIAGKAKAKETTAVQDLESRFLTLLMTQIKNQDPLNPLDNAQVTSQLAQLNMVNGIEKLNLTMNQLLGGYAEAQAMQAAGMIGKNVMIAGNALPLSGSKAFAGIALTGNADSVVVTIKDASGKVVQTNELGEQQAGVFYFAWDGKNENGDVLPDGKYTFSIKALADGKEIEATTGQIGMVSAVTRTNNGFLLDLGDMGNVAFKDIQQIL